MTTTLGVEDLAASELSELAEVSVRSVEPGKVFFEAGLEAMYSVNFGSRIANRLYLLLARERFESLDDIYRVARSIDYTEVIEPGQSFAVRCERVGTHGFTSVDVGRVVGQAVIDSYASSRSARLRVNLDEPDVELGVFVRFDEVLIGVNTTGDSLHRRGYRVYNHPAALKPTLAAAMLRFGGYSGEPLLDPLCGGGTIVIEAAHAARRYPTALFRQDYRFRRLSIHDPALEREALAKILERLDPSAYEISCMEISPKHLRGARENARAARVLDTVRFLLRDATRRESYQDVSAKFIATNPPYGMKSHSLKKIETFYETILRVLGEAYRGVRMVAITASTSQFERACERVEVRVEHSRRVMHGGLSAKVYVLLLG